LFEKKGNLHETRLPGGPARERGFLGTEPFQAAPIVLP
jgi:hypothetical protein